jgi:deoxyribose-phosphate aldolase
MDEVRERVFEGHNRPRNPGAPLDPAWFEGVGVNASAVERRAATLTTRRSVKKEYQAAWLVKALTCIDLTTLAGDDTPERVRRLCAKARRPLNDDLLAALGLVDAPPTVGAVCVYPTMVAPAVRALEGSGIPVASARARARSTSSSREPTCSAGTGRRSSTRSPRCARLAGSRI